MIRRYGFLPPAILWAVFCSLLFEYNPLAMLISAGLGSFLIGFVWAVLFYEEK